MIEVLVGWIGRVILIAFVVRMVLRLFSGGARPTAAQAGAEPSRGGRGDRGGRTEKSVDKLVRDPQCGTYVAEHNSVTASHGGATVHFCSTTCRDAYLTSPAATA